jgi:large subunit ribosomal protein L33
LPWDAAWRPLALFCPRRAGAEKTMQETISLACSECKRRNYTTTKNKKTNTEKLELSKYCRFCRKHTAHKEGKV